jgi:hypothetical protein
MSETKQIPVPLVLRTDQANVGIRMEDGYDKNSMRRISVIMTVDGVDWTPVFCPSPVEAARVVHALYSILDRYGTTEWEQGYYRCTSSAAEDNDALAVWGSGESEELG